MKDFEGNLNIQNGLNRLVNQFNTLNLPTIGYLTFNQIMDISGCNKEDTFKIIRYLSGERLRLLEVVFIYINPIMNTKHRLNDDELKLIKEFDIFKCPESGEMIEGYGKKISVVFKILYNEVDRLIFSSHN